MLQREELWNNWKNDGCKEFKRPESQIDDTPKPAKRQKRHLGDLIKDADKQGKFYMGKYVLKFVLKNVYLLIVCLQS